MKILRLFVLHVEFVGFLAVCSIFVVRIVGFCCVDAGSVYDADCLYREI